MLLISHSQHETWESKLTFTCWKGLIKLFDQSISLTIKQLDAYIRWDYASYFPQPSATPALKDDLFLESEESNGIDTYDSRVMENMKHMNWFSLISMT